MFCKCFVLQPSLKRFTHVYVETYAKCLKTFCYDCTRLELRCEMVRCKIKCTTFAEQYLTCSCFVCNHTPYDMSNNNNNNKKKNLN